ncbi:hypothetical protein [Brevibacterium spongiae]|uniref:Uncharacterized protein n=1 Tax=Brevibacterium spongiae TaxID=2909672 RepID=A0ABY5STS3_9MICO|nr:hypothetical protein [Brevibacterium spongiae]UVI37995.1 hypothetical protein L1F31_13325 [Brevibacterium spongiae]
MFRQLTYRLIPLMLGLIPAPPPRGGTTITEAADQVIDPDSAADNDLDSDADLNLAADADRPDRGDVPGWVLITLMTAGLVVALWALAGEAFTSMFQDAMNKVRGAG